MALPYIIEHYRSFLPSVTGKTPLLTLGEGGTPLERADGLSALLESRDVAVFLKREDKNFPTYSFKDRGMVLTVAKASELGALAIICASTGNTYASASAYGQAHGLKVIGFAPKKDVAPGKVAQARMYGANLVPVEGNFDEALRQVKLLAEELFPRAILVNSVNPHRIEAQKTAAFEVCDQLGKAMEIGRPASPDYLFLPVGNAGNITAYWLGFQEYHCAGMVDCLPMMMGWQAEGADPIVKGHVIEDPHTIASAIKIGNPASWKKAVTARDESYGVIGSVTDDEIRRAQFILAAKIGMAAFVEPASAASVAGLLKYDKEHGLKHGSTVVCVVTGAGLKDSANAIATADIYNPVSLADGGNIADLVLKEFRKQADLLTF